MARETATTRWPKIVQNMIDDVEATFGQSDIPEQIEEGRRIQATLRIMKCEIMQDKPLQCVNFPTLCYSFLEMADVDPKSVSPLSSDGHPDIQSYNAQLASFGKITWHNCPWLFAECYLYRHVAVSNASCLS
jgi:damage-control phosphatase, subfamily III